MPINLKDFNIDAAVWSSCKYFSSGPGSIGGIYVNKKRTLNRQEFIEWFDYFKYAFNNGPFEKDDENSFTHFDPNHVANL